MGGGKDFFYLVSPEVFAFPGIVPRSHSLPDLGNLAARAASIFKNGHPFPLSQTDFVKALLMKEPMGQKISLAGGWSKCRFERKPAASVAHH
jgi:hypothetical protein